MTRWSDLAVWVGPTPNQGGAMTEARGLVLHIQEGTQAGSLAWSKNPASEVSAHFYVAKDGSVAQLVDTDTVAWTQAAGNGHWLSVENEGFHTEALTGEQLEAVAQLYARGVQLYGWPLSATDSTSGRGLGWHGMGGDAWGGHPDCPGDRIKAQRPAILARAAQTIAGGSGAQSTVEDGMGTIVKNADDGKFYMLGGDGVARRLALTSANGIADVGYVVSGRYDPSGKDAGPRPGRLPFTNAPTGAAPWIDIPVIPLGVLALVDVDQAGGQVALPVQLDIIGGTLNLAAK